MRTLSVSSIARVVIRRSARIVADRSVRIVARHSTVCLMVLLTPLAARAQRPAWRHSAVDTVAASLLTPADVEQITGIRGVHLIPRGTAVGARGDLNFVRQDGKLVLMVNIGTAEQYEQARTQRDVEVGGRKLPMPLFNAAVPDVGDEAFNGPPGDQPYVLYVRKGSTGLSFTTSFVSVERTMRPVITQAQLVQLARRMLVRM
ncbi:MAG TPA: hypothetical protein VFJ96_13830 [Gemmatimonadaceae bacterium]|nr:hypothetical protein [Gemmatimonadaceae bacterium]